VFSWALLTALGCSSPERDLGQTRDARADEAEGGEDCAVSGAVDERDAPQASYASDFVGLWIGQAEDALPSDEVETALPIYAFPSGSTRILLEVTRADSPLARLTFGESPTPPSGTNPKRGAVLDSDAHVRRSGTALGALPPSEGQVYSAEPVASALDLERSGEDELEATRLALDGKLVLAFSTRSSFVSELHVRFAGNGLVGVFDGLSLLNARGFLTRPGSVRFRRAAAAERSAVDR